MDRHGRMLDKLTREELIEEIGYLRAELRRAQWMHSNDREKLWRYRRQAERDDERIKELIALASEAVAECLGMRQSGQAPATTDEANRGEDEGHPPPPPQPGRS